MRRYLLATAAATGAGFLFACSAVLGVDDFKVDPNLADGGSNLGDTGTNDTDGQTSGDSGDSGDSGEGGSGECKVNADCATRGENFICRKSDLTCVSIVSPDCLHVLGDYKNDDAIILGSLLPTDGADKTSGLPCQNAIDLAINEFKDFATGLPPATGSTVRRPLVLVGCNDDSSGDTAVRAAQHLVNNVKVPAIIGAAFSGITIRTANEVTIPGGTFLISPSATSVLLTSLADNNLVWRTTASDLIQSDGHVALYPLLESRVKSERGDSQYKVKVAIAHKGDPYGSGLADALSDKLTINGAPFLDASNADFRLVANYGNPDANPPTSNYSAALESVWAKKPDIIYLMGTTEAVNEMLKQLEADWETKTQNAPRPIYLLADGGAVTQLADVVNAVKTQFNEATADNLRKRIYGTIPGSTSQIFQKFRTRYNAVFSDGAASTSGVANSYDALYNIAYAITSLGDKPVTGANIAGAMEKLVSGPLIETGTATINTAFNALLAGNPIDYNGASGPLNYDLATGDTPGDIQIWCVNKSSGVAQPPAGTTVFYDSADKTLKGTLGDIATSCNFP